MLSRDLYRQASSSGYTSHAYEIGFKVQVTRDGVVRAVMPQDRRQPARGLTGGYNEVEECAKGLVSEACGGNPVEW